MFQTAAIAHTFVLLIYFINILSILVWPPVHLHLPVAPWISRPCWCRSRRIVCELHRIKWVARAALEMKIATLSHGGRAQVHSWCPTTVHVCVGKPSAMVVRRLKTNKGHNANNVNSLLLDRASLLSSVRVCVCVFVCMRVYKIWFYANQKPHRYVGHIKAYTPFSVTYTRTEAHVIQAHIQNTCARETHLRTCVQFS